MAAEDISIRSSTVLVVEDNATNRLVAVNYLKTCGFNVLVAKHGEEGLRMVAQASPDLILLDVMMPGMDGFEVCRQLKQQPESRDIPVIFMTALTETQNKVEGFQVGGVDYITKPIKPEELFARVDVHLKLRALSQALAERTAALESANRQLYRLATLDGLTQVANRRCFDERLAQEWKRLARERSPLSLLLIDIDHFKPYNDHYGHLGGDECLYRVAQALERGVARPADLVARYGGEEFAVLLPNTDRAGAAHLGQQLKAEVDRLQLPHAQSPVKRCITLSVGLATLRPRQEEQLTKLIERADRALYRAKQLGRDRLVMDDE